ncbi:MAG: molybdenum cofactor guanylyltransferase MobA [Pikeienuella sp.]|uniref:molybdenum cofactor guanylyltransferase MobA n=1 Tax=Pikeienuella sp. TaxID=2831957 RepID=UPI00391C5B23
MRSSGGRRRRHTGFRLERVNPFGVILAGGRATRMGGGDKTLRLVAGRTLLARAVERLSTQVVAMAINANGDPERFSAFGLPVIPDGAADFPGPLAGVLAGMDWAALHGQTHILTAAGDTPFFPEDLGPRLAAALSEGIPAAFAAGADGRAHPTFGLWPVARREDLRAALAAGIRKVTLWAERCGAVAVPFPAARYDPFFNVNAPDDIAAAERIVAEHGL